MLILEFMPNVELLQKVHWSNTEKEKKKGRNVAFVGVLYWLW